MLIRKNDTKMSFVTCTSYSVVVDKYLIAIRENLVRTGTFSMYKTYTRLCYALHYKISVYSIYTGWSPCTDHQRFFVWENNVTYRQKGGGGMIKELKSK